MLSKEQNMEMEEDNPKAANGKVHNVNGDLEMADLKQKTARFEAMPSPDLRVALKKPSPELFVDLKGNPSDKSKTGAWRAAPFVYGLIFADYLGFISTGANMVTYLMFVMHLSVSRSSNTVTNWVGTVFVVPTFWGFIADAYLGRYWTLVITSCIQILGMVLLTISTSVSSLRPAACDRTVQACPEASDSDLNFLLTALFLMAIGSGGVKSAVPAFGQEQFDHSLPEERRAGSHYFNWYFFASSMGNLVAYSLMVYVQDHTGRGWGYGIITGVFTLATVIFLLGTPVYRHRRPTGSAFTRIAQVLVCACRHWNRSVPQDHQDLYEISFLDADDSHPFERLPHTNKFRLLDKAAVAKRSEVMAGVSPWQLCPVSQVEELKRMLLMLPIWITNVFLFTALTQMSTYNVIQATTMNRGMGKHFQIPAASLGTFGVLSVVIITPIYDFLFVPFARKYTGHERGITPLQRMSVGFVLAFLGLVTAALVENKRVKQIRHHNLGYLPVGAFTVPMSVFWLLPQLVLVSQIEFFSSVASLEIFYGDAPRSMKSISTALTFSAVGVGSFITSSLVSAVNKYSKDSKNPHSQWLADGGINHGGLTKFFWLLAIVILVDFFVFLLVARWYQYKKGEKGETVSSSQRYTVLEEARLSNFPENIH